MRRRGRRWFELERERRSRAQDALTPPARARLAAENEALHRRQQDAARRRSYRVDDDLPGA